jgi:Lon protease-like protein
MTQTPALPDILPLFPLPGALLLPRSRLPLHLFEPRYLAMFDDALKTSERMIAMIQPRKTPDGCDDALHSIGCAGRITQFSETDDNRYMITLTGISRYRIVQEIEGFPPYRRAEVSWQGFERDLGPKDVDPYFERPAFMQLLDRYFSDSELQTDWNALKEADDELLINSLSMLLKFGPQDRQALLESPCLSSRRETLIALIEFAIRGGPNKETLQ